MTASSQPVPATSEDQGATLSALQPIYAALVREFVIEGSDSPGDEAFSASSQSAEPANAWFEQVDSRLQVHQLRQFLQTSPLVSEAVLRHLLLHHLRKPAKSATDRDKVDFLMVQYFSLCAPSGMEDADVDLDYVAQVLEPVLGPLEPKLPAWLTPLETVLRLALGCRRLGELLQSGALEQGRKLKTQSADRYFEPSAMAAFARFSFMLRRIFFRLMHDDLNAIQDGLRQLERRGVATVDCRRAQFSAEEPIARLRMICQSWKVMFHAEYSAGQPLRMLVDLRAAVDDALKGGASKSTAAKRAAGASTKHGSGKQK